jgi:hypothetical protein
MRAPSTKRRNKMKIPKEKVIADTRRNLALSAFSKKSGEMRTKFLKKLQELTGDDVPMHQDSMAPKGQNNIWTRPVYVPPNTTPARAGANDHMKHTRVGYPT